MGRRIAKTMTRRITTVEEVMAYVRRLKYPVVTPIDVAKRFGISTATARRKLDGLCYQKKLVLDKYSSTGFSLTWENWRYADVEWNPPIDDYDE